MAEEKKVEEKEVEEKKVEKKKIITTTDDNDAWTTVISKKTKNHIKKQAKMEVIQSETECMKFCFFRDDANTNFMDFA